MNLLLYKLKWKYSEKCSARFFRANSFFIQTIFIQTKNFSFNLTKQKILFKKLELTPFFNNFPQDKTEMIIQFSQLIVNFL